MRRSGRFSLAALGSAVAHGVLAAVVLLLAQIAPPSMPRQNRTLVFVRMAPPPIFFDTPLELPALESTMEEPPVAVAWPEPPPPAPAPKVEPPARVEPSPPPLAKIEAPKPVSPPVTLGLFADPASAPIASEPVKRVEASGFDAPSPVAKAPTQAVAAALGAFDVRSESASRARQTVVVAAGGFGAARSDTPPTKQAMAPVRSSGFDDVRQHTPAPAKPKAEPIDEPVEITFKPAPVYTADARSLKLEGDVHLDVQFEATGVVRVLGVTKGLGHGLDEAAVRAAAAIKFKPARSGGRPIDFRTTVHIVFRLA